MTWFLVNPIISVEVEDGVSPDLVRASVSFDNQNVALSQPEAVQFRFGHLKSFDLRQIQ